MKKMMLVAMVMFSAVAGFAQFKFGAQAIGNLSTASIKTTDVQLSKSSRILPGAGVVAQYDVSDRLAVRTGINYLQYGVTAKGPVNPTVNPKVKVENTLHYLQLPVNVIYSIPVGNMKVYGGAGGYANYGISGSTKITTTLRMPDGKESVSIEKQKSFKKEEQDGAGLKKFDAGVSALAGVLLNEKIFANVGYQLGLTDISEGTGKYKNRGLQVSIGYFF